ncbi:MAG: metal ABC transporter substrate-binding protein [Micrococcales bacterium]|nr:metal ABC transporter substrate-binding protein [Micrococcales bacterium]
MSRHFAPTRALTRALAGAVLVALTATACGSGAPSSDSDADGRPRVVTSFYPLAFATERIGGETLDVSTLTKPGAEPHDLELAPQDLTAMAGARLVIYSKGFQPAIDEGIAQVDPARVLDVSGPADLTPMAGPDGSEHPSGDKGGAEAKDPHFWLDPHRYAAVARAIEKRLAADDPANAATYHAGTRALVADLDKLDHDFATALRDCTIKDLVTSHSAFGYLAARYGFEQHGISGLSPEAEPSAAALKAITDLVKANGVTTIYQETLVEPHFAETVARSTGARLATLDPVEGITSESPGTDYFEVMRSNLAVLVKGQDCR